MPLFLASSGGRDVDTVTFTASATITASPEYGTIPSADITCNVPTGYKIIGLGFIAASNAYVRVSGAVFYNTSIASITWMNHSSFSDFTCNFTGTAIIKKQ